MDSPTLEKKALPAVCAAPTVFHKVISLGGSCQVANQLNRLHLRQDSFPYDWLFSCYDDAKFIESFENDLADWMLWENLKEDPHTVTAHRKVTDTRYGMVHQHIFPLDVPLADSYGAVLETVRRRIRRLLGLQGKNLPLLFVRTNLSVPDAERLAAVIARKYGPKAHLLAVTHSKLFEMQEIPLRAPNARMFRIYDSNDGGPNDVWQGFDPHWDRLLANVRIEDETADLADGVLFRGFHPCEKSEGRAFRWGAEGSSLFLERFGGCRCDVKLHLPVPMAVTALDVRGRTLWTSGERAAGDASFSFVVTHDSRTVTLASSRIWRPIDLYSDALKTACRHLRPGTFFKSLEDVSHALNGIRVRDDRPLSFRLDGLSFHRGT